MKVETYKCDECGVVKEKSNHWVLASIDEHVMSFSPWDAEMADQEGVLTLCGEGCAAKTLGKVIQGWHS